MSKRLFAVDLVAHLDGLAKHLEHESSPELAKRVRFVMEYASGSTSELFGEARSLLSDVLRDGSAALGADRRDELKGVISGIDAEFRRVGGG